MKSLILGCALLISPSLFASGKMNINTAKKACNSLIRHNTEYKRACLSGAIFTHSLGEEKAEEKCMQIYTSELERQVRDISVTGAEAIGGLFKSLSISNGAFADTELDLIKGIQEPMSDLTKLPRRIIALKEGCLVGVYLNY